MYHVEKKRLQQEWSKSAENERLKKQKKLQNSKMKSSFCFPNKKPQSHHLSRKKNARKAHCGWSRKLLIVLEEQTSVSFSLTETFSAQDDNVFNAPKSISHSL